MELTEEGEAAPAPPAPPAELLMAAFTAAGVLLLIGAAATVGTARLTLGRWLGSGRQIEQTYVLAVPLAVVVALVVLVRQRRLRRWPFPTPPRLPRPPAVIAASAFAAVGIGLYTALLEHVAIGAVSPSEGIGVVLALAALLGLALAEARRRTGLAALLAFWLAFDLSVKAGLELGTGGVVWTAPNLACLAVALAGAALFATADRARAARAASPEPERTRRWVGVPLTALACGWLAVVVFTAAQGRYGYWGQKKAAAHRAVVEEALPYLRGAVTSLLPARWEGSFPAELRRTVEEGAGAPRQRVALLVEGPPREPLSEMLDRGLEAHRLYDARHDGSLHWTLRRGIEGLEDGEADGWTFTLRSGGMHLPPNLLILGELTGPDGTRYQVALRWEHAYDRRQGRKAALDEVLPR